MNFEIERKFLVPDLSFKKEATKVEEIRQGYIAHEKGRSVRVRILDGKGILTIKGPTLDGISRMEWEKEIPVEEALELLTLSCSSIIWKERHIIPAAGGRKWEVDVFHGDNEGLVMAEVELSAIDEGVEFPEFIGTEVTGDARYYNSHLRQNPYKNWAK